jgi:hypothetical protein
VTARRKETCPKKIFRSRHSSLIERTKRFACAFRLGDRGDGGITAVLDFAIRLPDAESIMMKEKRDDIVSNWTT